MTTDGDNDAEACLRTGIRGGAFAKGGITYSLHPKTEIKFVVVVGGGK